MNASVEVGCDLRRIHTANAPDLKCCNEGKNEIDDVDVSSLSQATIDMTTIGDLRRNEADEASKMVNDEATYSVSCGDSRLTDVSAIEARNRSFFDRVTLAVSI